MEMKTNSRQVPKTKGICASKKYYDILYSYLQCISQKDDQGRRIFNKKEINFTHLGNKFSLTRQTVATKFKNLKELNLIKEIDDEKYELIVLEKDLASLVPYGTLKLLVDSLNDNSISTYVYLFNCSFLYWCT